MGLDSPRLLSRRSCVLGIVSVVANLPETLSVTRVESADAKREFEKVLQAILSDPQITWSMRGNDEFAEGIREKQERAPSAHAKSATAISERATQLIVACEVSNEATYKKFYYKPVAPKGGASGVTIGIGYDIGEASPAELKRDWIDYLASDEIATLSKACGITGKAANEKLQEIINEHDIKISWEIACAEFAKESRPRYVGLTEESLENTESLHPDSLGALVSLVYNRGPSFRQEGPRYLEMRNVFDHMKSKRFDKIPGEIRNMKHLWRNNPDDRGLLLRRDAEASLFEIGLQ